MQKKYKSNDFHLRFFSLLSATTLVFLWGVIFLDDLNRKLFGARHTRYHTGKYLVISFCIAISPYLLYFLYKKLRFVIPRITGLLQKKFSSPASVIISLTIFILVFGYAGVFARLGVDTHHDGIAFKTALDLANGNRLFRDTFSQFNGLAAVTGAWFLTVFGRYLIVIKLLTVAHYGAIGVLLWLIWRRFLPDIFALLSVAVWLIMAPYVHNTFLAWPSVYALFWQLLSLLFFLKYLEKNKRIFLIPAGIAVVFCYLSRQTTGFFVAGSYIAFFLLLAIVRKKSLLKKLLKDLPVMAIGALMILAGYFLWLGLNGALADWWKQTVSYAYYFGKLNGRGFQITAILSDLLAYDNSVVWMRMPLLNLILLTVLTVKIFRSKEIKRMMLALGIFLTVNLGSWMQYYPVPEERHFYWSSTPMVGSSVLFIFIMSGKLAAFVSVLIEHLLRGTRLLEKEFTVWFFRTVTFLALLYLLFVPIIKDRLVEAGKTLSKEYVEAQSPPVLKGMLLIREDEKYFRHVEDLFNQYFREYPDDKLVNVGIEVLYQTFAPQKKNFHPLFSDTRVNDLLYENYSREQTAYIKKEQPLVLSDRDYLLAGYCEVPGSVGYKDFELYASCQKLSKSSQKLTD